MKKLRVPWHFLVVLLLAITCATPARSADAGHVGAYDFGYLLSGDVRAKPVQVFDDGRDTYFQFRAGEPVPAIFAARAGAPQLLVPAQEGPYVRVPQVYGRFVLQVGRAQANVVHAGGGRPDAPAVTAVAANGMTTPYTGSGAPGPGGRLVASLAPVAINLSSEPALDRNSYATPVRGDRVYWPERSEQVEHGIAFARGGYVLSRGAQRVLAMIVAHAAPAARFTVIGRDDDSYKEGLDGARARALREALVKGGIGGDRITVRTGVALPARKGNLWESTVIVETPEHAPAMHVAATQANAAEAVAAHVEALVRSGVLDRRQAEALLMRERFGPHAAGVPLAALPAPEIPEGGFTLSAADRTIAGAVRRWAQALQYQVVWDAPPQLDAAITGEVRLPGENIAQALDHLVRGLMEKGYALEVTIYANRVIRFTAASADGPKPPMAPASLARPGSAEATAGRTAQWLTTDADRTLVVSSY